MRKDDPARVDRLVVGEGVALADVARGPAQAAQDQRPELLARRSAALRSSWVSRLAPGRRGSAGASNAAGRGRRRSGRTARGPRRAAGRPCAGSRRPDLRTGAARRRPTRQARRRPGTASAPRAPASCMTPRPWVKRECSAVGKTQRALWSWLIRRSRCSQAVSRRSSSATSSAGSPAAADSAGPSRLVSSMYPWIGSLMKLTAANGCRRTDPVRAPRCETRAVHAPTLPRRSVPRTRIA